MIKLLFIKAQEPQEEKYPEEVEPQEMKVAEKLSLLGKLHNARMIADRRKFQDAARKVVHSL